MVGRKLPAPHETNGGVMQTGGRGQPLPPEAGNAICQSGRGRSGAAVLGRSQIACQTNCQIGRVKWHRSCYNCQNGKSKRCAKPKMADLPKWQNFLAVPLGSSGAFDLPIIFCRMKAQEKTTPKENGSSCLTSSTDSVR